MNELLPQAPLPKKHWVKPEIILLCADPIRAKNTIANREVNNGNQSKVTIPGGSPQTVPFTVYNLAESHS